MSQITALGVSVVVSVLVSSVLVASLMKPLRGVLDQLCPGSGATAFWLTFTTIMLYVTPLLFTVAFPNPVPVPDLVNMVRSTLASSLFGSFAALLVVGLQIARARPPSK